MPNYTSYSEENTPTLDFVSVHMNISNRVNVSKSCENLSKYAHRLWTLHTEMTYSLICYASHALVSDFFKKILIPFFNG